jgi:hypothetical protein
MLIYNFIVVHFLALASGHLLHLVDSFTSSHQAPGSQLITPSSVLKLCVASAIQYTSSLSSSPKRLAVFSDNLNTIQIFNS